MVAVTVPTGSTGIVQSPRRVIIASSLGTVFEWYDFFLYGSLAAVISKQFFAGVNETTGFMFALLTWAAGFAVRPLGALVFGRLGDLVGRKRTFLITIVIMGTATAVVGILPTYASVGLVAPIALVALRMLQGLAVGGEYGGAAIYVAEHAPPGKRGLYTSWIQTTSTLGLILSLLVIMSCRALLGAEFDTWGWRIPFLLSVVLLIISVYVRMQLAESPVFQRMVASGSRSQAPIRESFGTWKNLKTVLLSLFGATAGMTVTWYTGHFYSLFFLTQTLKIDAQIANILMCIALVMAMPLFVTMGWLSDRIGRKRLLLLGCVLAVITYFPIFRGLTHYANPAIEEAAQRAPVTVITDANGCSFQFDPLGKARFVRSCDIAKAALAKAGVPYTSEAGGAGTVAVVRIGNAAEAPPVVVTSFEGGQLSAAQFKEASARFGAALTESLKQAGYPTKADPARINRPMVVLLLLTLLFYVSLTYGPLAAWLVELFPPRIRYTSLSVPYHIAVGWLGGFLAPVAFAIVAITGNIYSGLWYPVLIAAASACVGAFFLPDTHGDPSETSVGPIGTRGTAHI
jgi:MFS family permease